LCEKREKRRSEGDQIPICSSVDIGYMPLGAGCCSDESAVSLRTRQGRLILCGPEVVASWLVRTDRTISADVACLRQQCIRRRHGKKDGSINENCGAMLHSTLLQFQNRCLEGPRADDYRDVARRESLKLCVVNSNYNS